MDSSGQRHGDRQDKLRTFADPTLSSQHPLSSCPRLTPFIPRPTAPLRPCSLAPSHAAPPTPFPSLRMAHARMHAVPEPDRVIDAAVLRTPDPGPRTPPGLRRNSREVRRVIISRVLRHGTYGPAERNGTERGRNGDGVEWSPAPGGGERAGRSTFDAEPVHRRRRAVRGRGRYGIGGVRSVGVVPRCGNGVAARGTIRWGTVR